MEGGGEGEGRGRRGGPWTLSEVETELAHSHHVSATVHGGEEVEESVLCRQTVATESRGQEGQEKVT